MKKLRAISIMICQSILVVSVMACTGERDKQTDTDAVPVTVGKVQKVQERETVSVSGTVTTPDSPVAVSFLVSGKVIFVGPREGDYVKRGQSLASIDPTDYQLALTAATKQKDMAEVAHKRAEDEHRRRKCCTTRIVLPRTITRNSKLRLIPLPGSTSRPLPRKICPGNILRMRLYIPPRAATSQNE
jgi:multidrug efflux pump subunit AcrA (membrane-fusion protein)